MGRSRRSLLESLLPSATLVLAALGGCDGGEIAPLVPSTEIRVGPRLTRLRPTLAPALDTLPAADPRMPGFDGWDIAFDAQHHDRGSHRCAMDFVRAGAVVRSVEGNLDAGGCRARWDGRDARGEHVAPGPLLATARIVDASGAELARASAALEVVRIGIDRVQLAAASGARIALLYRATAGLQDGWYEVAATDVPWQMAPEPDEVGGVPLERPDGSPREVPEPHDDLLSPPLDPRAPDGVEHDTYNLPTAWIAGSTLLAIVRFSSSVAGAPAGGEPRDVEIRLVAPDGTAIVGEDRFGDARQVRIETMESPVPAVGRYELRWTFRFEARRADDPTAEWQPIPGALETRHRLYGLVGEPVFDSPVVPNRAWVDVVDRVATWVGGESADPSRVADAIVEGVYRTMDLRYDTARGASAYTEYTRGFSGAVFYLQAFQDRAWGRIVNCSDAASIVGAYANMVGIDLRYHILTNRAGIDYGFDLNYIQAIGMPAFDDTPFDSGRGAFRYHAIVGSRDARSYDATLAIDGDGAPEAPPHRQTLVQSMEPLVYLRALSSQWDAIRTDLDERARIR